MNAEWVFRAHIGVEYCEEATTLCQTDSKCLQVDKSNDEINRPGIVPYRLRSSCRRRSIINGSLGRCSWALRSMRAARASLLMNFRLACKYKFHLHPAAGQSVQHGVYQVEFGGIQMKSKKWNCNGSAVTSTPTH